MALPQPTWERCDCCYYRISRLLYEQRQYRLQNLIDQQHRSKLMPTDQFKFYVNVIARSTVVNAAIPVNHNSDLFIDCKRFFQEGQAFLRPYLSNQYVPSESLDQVTEGIINKVQQSFEFEFEFDHGDGDGDGDGKFLDLKPNVFALVLDLIVVVDEHLVMEDSMREIRMVPTSMEAIESLQQQKFRFGMKDFDCGDQVCSICTEDFDGGDQVLPMPCGHVFHQHCLLQWLHASHTCPLCRYSMPTAQ